MIYTVTFNPSLDYNISVENFKPGEVNRTTEEMICEGGKGLNVSVVLKNLGVESTALGFLAGFTGNEIKRLVKRRGIASDFIEVEEGLSRINIKIHAKEESEINAKGPKIEDKHLQKLYRKFDTLQDGDILVLSGSVLPGMSEMVYKDIMEYLEKKNIKIAVDATKQLLTNILPYHPFVIKPNHHELGELFGVEIKNKKDAVTYAKKLREMGAQNVIVSMGGKGAVFISEDGSAYESNAPKGKVVNTVGAGDSMLAGFLAGYIKTGDYKESFKLGICAGSASAFSKKLAEKAEIEMLLEKHKFNF